MWETVNDCMLQSWLLCAHQIKPRGGNVCVTFHDNDVNGTRREIAKKQRRYQAEEHGNFKSFGACCWHLEDYWLFPCRYAPCLVATCHIASCIHLLVKGLPLSPVSMHFPQGLHWSGNMGLLTPWWCPSFKAPSMTLTHAFNCIFHTFLVSWSQASSLNVFTLIEAVRKQVTGHTRWTRASNFKPEQNVGFSGFA